MMNSSQVGNTLLWDGWKILIKSSDQSPILSKGWDHLLWKIFYSSCGAHHFNGPDQHGSMDSSKIEEPWWAWAAISRSIVTDRPGQFVGFGPSRQQRGSHFQKKWSNWQVRYNFSCKGWDHLGMVKSAYIEKDI